MRRHVLLAAVAVVAAATLVAPAGAAVTPGAYTGFLYSTTTGKKGASATVTVVGKKVTIKVAKFPLKCRDAMGNFTRPGGTLAYEWRGTLKKGDYVSGVMRPLDQSIVGELFASGVFTPATTSFAGKLFAEVSDGDCKNTWEIKATLP